MMAMILSMCRSMGDRIKASQGKFFRPVLRHIGQKSNTGKKDKNPVSLASWKRWLVGTDILEPDGLP